jgi:phospholipase/lecithinase/hemolysin
MNFNLKEFAMYKTHFLVALFFITTCSSPAKADFYYFGDSLSDSGNYYNLTGDPSPTTTPYVGGRFSNGPTWAENYAARFGMTATPSRLGGTNYAYAFGTTGPSNPASPITLLDQVDQYINDGSPGTANDTFFVWSGANDIFNAAVDANPTNVITAALFHTSSSIQTLFGAGARNFVVLHSVPMGQIPYAQQTEPFAAGTIDGLNQLSQGFNGGLSQVIMGLEINLGIDIVEVDMYSYMLEIQADPGSFGLVNASGSVVPFNPPITGLAAGPPAAVDADTYLFWDGLHPTAMGHQLLADRVYAATVPEPSAVALLASMGVAFCFRRRRS